MASRRVALKVITDVAKNTAMHIPPVRSRRLLHTRAGAANPTDLSIERYALQGLRLLHENIGDLTGRSVVEFGPGDLLSSGLAILAAGADRYAVVDRFQGDYGSSRGRQWYLAIQEAWPRLCPQQAWPRWLDASVFPQAYSDRIQIIDGRVESARTRDRFDIVCSFQVAEHVTCIRAFAHATSEMLNANGTAVHRIDFGPHDWAGYGDAFTFLRFPNWLWTAMGSERGVPNRVRLDEVVEALTDAGLAVEIVGVEEIDAIPEPLPRKLRGLSEAAVRTEAATVICSHAS